MAVPISIKALTKRFGATLAVDRTDLEVPAGSLFFLLGPSGCGKTTLLRMIAGFIEPTAGSIHLAGRDVTGSPPNRRNCGMVFQSYALWPHMTVRQNVAFGLTVRKIAAEEINRRVAMALKTVQMLEYAERKPNELSGGQQQRVALARALVIEPDVLLLDEPLSNLDAKLRIEMRAQIRQVCKAADITAVYVTHDQKEALSMADQMAVLHAGRVVQVGPPRSLYDRPANRFVADFLGETNFLPGQVAGREGKELIVQTPLGALRCGAFPADTAQGAVVTVSLRPEALKVLTGPAPAGEAVNTFTARRVESTYLGEVAQHRLAVGGAVVLKVFELNPRPFLGQDAPVRVAVAPQDVVALRD